MDEVIHINQVEDFFGSILKKYDFREEKIGREYNYLVSEKYGSGYINRLVLESGININVCDVIFHNDLVIHYKMKQPQFEIAHILLGDLVFFDGEINSVIRMQNGEVNITFKNYTDGWIKYQSKQHYKCISVAAPHKLSSVLNIDEDFEDELNDPINNNNELGNFLIRPQKIDPILQVPFIQIGNCNASSLTRYIYLESKAKEIVALVIDNDILRYKNMFGKIKLNKSDINKIYKIKEILIDNMEKPLSIVELSKRLGLNTYKLKVGFKEIFGTTVFGYIRDMRMEKARLLLENNELNINEIANEVGYSNPSHFAAAFRKKYGANPAHFRF